MPHNLRREPLPCKPHPKITRPGKRKRVTLIVAIRCETGVVVCADSQETVDNDYRVTVRKIKPRDCNHYDLVVGGSGDIGGLIDGQARALEESVKAWPSGASEEDCRTWLEGIVGTYSDDQVMPYPADLSEKILRFVICVRDKTSSSVFLWKTEANIVQPVDDYVLVGWKEHLYDHEASRLYSEGLTGLQSTVLGLRLLSLGKATSNYIGDPFQVIVVGYGGVVTESQDTVEALQKRIKQRNDALSEIDTITANLSVSDQALDDALRHFREAILGLRREVRAHTLQVHDAQHGHTANNIPLGVDDSERP